MSFICGFNSFDQFKSSTDFECAGENSASFSFLLDIEVLDFSWSGFLFRNGDTVRYCGFVDDRSGQIVDVVLPNRERIAKCRCRDGSVIVVTESGTCLEFNLHNEIWNDLTLRESENDENQSQTVTDLSTSDNTVLLLTNLGQVYSYPSLISIPGIIVTQVTCGFEHSAVLSDTGFVYTWGGGSRGQLGHGDIENRDEPEELVALSGLGVVSIFAGGWHTCAITSSGDLYSWGWNHHHQLGVDSSDKSEVVSEPTVVRMPDDEIPVKSASCGSKHTVVLLEDGSVYGCGSNKWCQLGDGEDSSVTRMTCIFKPPEGVSVKSVVASHWNTAIVC